MSSARRTDKEPTAANGYRHGRPAEVAKHPLDAAIASAIEAIPAELRLYPDIYSWEITAAVRKHLNGELLR